jgi:site-specific DNA-methyltransferase (adenine-specific)
MRASDVAAVAAVLEGAARWAVVEGDALAVLAALPDACVDAVVCDPPYSSGGQFRGDRVGAPSAKYIQNGGGVVRPEFAGDNRDGRGYAYWAALWLGECLRVAKPGAPCVVFTDWRQLPTTTDAVQAGGWVWRGIVPWDKTEGSRPQPGRFRAQCEYAVWASAGAMDEARPVPVLPGVVRAKVMADGKFHIAGKPVPVMRELVRICAPGGVVLDPFCGSGSTGVAALLESLRFVGVDLERTWCDVARARVGGTAGQASEAAEPLFAREVPRG